MARARPVILLTGFGPFPGRPENLTSRLVPELARRAERRFRGHEVISDVFPTEWQRAPRRLADLYAQHTPKVALHFGVAEGATGFTVETTAFNRCGNTLDAAGLMPSAVLIDAEGRDSVPTRLPADAIVARLIALNLPATLSPDAGSYLCNSIFYRALQHAAQQPRATLAGFIHIPTNLSEMPPADRPCRAFDWNVAVMGSLEIIRVCLGLVPRQTV